ncbi:hypothetical protein MBLNU13_g09498t2 [Cladosporium sp. NU13]
MPDRSTERGFMESIKHATYHEDIYINTNKDDFAEAGAFDLQDSSDDESSNSKTKHTRKNAKRIASYGSIKKPTYKPRIDAAFKIAPDRNARHSIRLVSPESEGEQSEHLDGHIAQLEIGSEKTSSARAFAAEKAQQHQLSGTARFENVRRQRAADRLRLHRACQQARKTKERALRDVETAAACLVDDVPMSASNIRINIDSSEVPSDFVDLTLRNASRSVPVAKEKKLTNKPWPPQNWKGENMDLSIGAAYVLIMDRE